MRRQIRYKIVERGSSHATGTGFTSDISSSGIRFTADQALPVNVMVEIAMSWPATLENACPLQLVARGRSVRCDGIFAVCTIEGFEFRTQARINTR